MGWSSTCSNVTRFSSVCQNQKSKKRFPLGRGVGFPHPRKKSRCFHLHQPDIWGLKKGIHQSLYILLLKTIPFLVQQNVGLVPGACWKATLYVHSAVWYLAHMYNTCLHNEMGPQKKGSPSRELKRTDLVPSSQFPDRNIKC